MMKIVIFLSYKTFFRVNVLSVVFTILYKK
jgi:hypothetical protein